MGCGCKKKRVAEPAPQPAAAKIDEGIKETPRPPDVLTAPEPNAEDVVNKLNHILRP